MLLRLQRTAGNHAIAGLLRHAGAPGARRIDRVARRSGLAPASERVLARAFAGFYGNTFNSTLSPTIQGDVARADDIRSQMRVIFRDTMYATYWNALSQSTEVIKVEPGANSYDGHARVPPFRRGCDRDPRPPAASLTSSQMPVYDQ